MVINNGQRGGAHRAAGGQAQHFTGAVAVYRVLIQDRHNGTVGVGTDRTGLIVCTGGGFSAGQRQQDGGGFAVWQYVVGAPVLPVQAALDGNQLCVGQGGGTGAAAVDAVLQQGHGLLHGGAARILQGKAQAGVVRGFLRGLGLGNGLSGGEGRKPGLQRAAGGEGQRQGGLGAQQGVVFVPAGELEAVVWLRGQGQFCAVQRGGLQRSAGAVDGQQGAVHRHGAVVLGDGFALDGGFCGLHGQGMCGVVLKHSGVHHVVTGGGIGPESPVGGGGNLLAAAVHPADKAVPFVGGGF